MSKCPSCQGFAYRVSDTQKIIERCMHCDYETIILDQRKENKPVPVERRYANKQKD